MLCVLCLQLVISNRSRVAEGAASRLCVLLGIGNLWRQLLFDVSRRVYLHWSDALATLVLSLYQAKISHPQSTCSGRIGRALPRKSQNPGVRFVAEERTVAGSEVSRILPIYAGWLGLILGVMGMERISDLDGRPLRHHTDHWKHL